LWIPDAKRLFGFTQAEPLGNSLDVIIPERLREGHWAGYRGTMASGETRYGHEVLRVPAVHKAGRALSTAFSVGLLYGRQREVTGIVAVIRDETARFAEERSLHKRLVELEKYVARAFSSRKYRINGTDWRVAQTSINYQSEKWHLCLQLKRNH
jgi:PAS domain S-box-containing protein